MQKPLYFAEDLKQKDFWELLPESGMIQDPEAPDLCLETLKKLRQHLLSEKRRNDPRFYADGSWIPDIHVWKMAFKWENGYCRTTPA